MVPSKHGMVIGGRGARACDMCGEERARWYCAADEAYLCQRCDISVHSANSVARRHDRVKLGSNGEPTLKLKPCRGDDRQKHLHRKTSKKSSTVVVPTTSMCSARLDDSHHEVPKIIDSNPDATMLDIPPIHSKQWPKASTKKRARTPRKCASNPNFSKPLPADPELITDPNPNYNGAVKEEKFGEDAILLYHLLAMEDEEDNRIGNLDVKVEPLSPCSTLTSKDVTEFNKAEESESTTHQVPILCNEPLLQELINDIMPPDDLNMENILPSSIDDASYSHHNHHHYSSYNKTEIGCLQRCDYNGIDGLSASSISSKMDTNGTFPEGSSGIDEEGESLLINDGDSDIDTFDVMDLCSNANFGDDGDGDGDEEEIDGCDIQGDFPDMDIWKEEEPCNSIFEGSPFKGEGERGFFDMACVKMEDSVLQSPATIAPPQSPPQLEKLLSLKLDYEEVLNAWSDRGSLWLNGQRPQMVPDILYFYGHGNLQGQYDGRLMSVMGESGGLASYGITRQVVPDSGREARVMRYREKRRTRLFAKKIRYEVRKLNAERRPRMKGRFVKRSEITTVM